MKTLLLVEDDDNQRMSIAELLRDGAGRRDRRRHRRGGLEAIQARRFDCAIVDLGLPDLPGAELIEQHPQDAREARSCRSSSIRARTSTKARGAPARAHRLDHHREGRGLLREAPDETALFLHRAIAAIPEEQADHRRAARRRLARGPEGPDHRRRRAQHLLPDERAGAARHGGRLRRERPRGHRDAAGTRRMWTSCSSTS